MLKTLLASAVALAILYGVVVFFWFAACRVGVEC